MRALFICGSLNQTIMMHKIAHHLPGFECHFTPFYADGLMGLIARAGLAEFSILGGKHRQAAEAYLTEHGLPVDFGGNAYVYDLIVTCTDLIIQANIRGKRLMLVQEGMTEAENFAYTLVKHLKFPRFIANTAAMGLSDAYDVFCVASKGYRDLFFHKGVKADKMVVTGIPNFDHVARYAQNNFPEQGYVLVATSSIRETWKYDNRERFLMQAKQLAGNQRVIFKLHPNENWQRARREISRHFASAEIYEQGNLHEMIANCSLFIAQNSSAIYTALALGKPVHSQLDQDKLKRLLPIQNGGRSAERIAEVCRQLAYTPLSEVRWNRRKSRQLQRKWASPHMA